LLSEKAAGTSLNSDAHGRCAVAIREISRCRSNTLLRVSVEVTPGRRLTAMKIPVPDGVRLAMLLMIAAIGFPCASLPVQPSVPV